MRAQMGFSLIEVLVALLILSMAVLGFLMVQMKSLHQSQSATMRAHHPSLVFSSDICAVPCAAHTAMILISGEYLMIAPAAA